MARAQFVYDESGGAFLYFVVSVYALVLIPLTYLVWPPKEKKEDPDKLKKRCQCEPCQTKRGTLKIKDPSSNAKIKFRQIFLLVAWTVFLILAYKASQVKTETVEFDPYEVLELDRGASTSEIKKKYRQLSRVHHPDKGGDHLTFMKIAKAYEALTDEEAKKNWEVYGNPDGPQATSFGIALPAWIVEKQNSMWVLAAYGIAFMVILPAVVGTWWYRSIKFSADQILLDTTQLFFYFFHKTPSMSIKRAILILTAAWEFEKSHNNEVAHRPSDNEEVPALLRELNNIVNQKVKEKPMCYPYALKARALVYAYLAKKNVLPPDTLQKDQDYILKKCPMLINEMITVISQLFVYAQAGRVQREPSLETLENCMKLSQMIVQRYFEQRSPLMQLPHFTEDVLRHCVTKKRNIRNLRTLASMKEADRRALLRNLDDKYDDVIKVLASIPNIEMEVKIEVLDDDEGGIIRAGDIVTVTVTLKRSTMESLFNQENEDSGIVEEEEQLDKTDSPKPTKNKPKVWEKQRKSKKNKPKKSKAPPQKKPVKKQQQQGKASQRVQEVGEKDNNEESDDESNRHSDADSDSDGDENPHKHSDRSSDSELDRARLADEGDVSEEEEDDWEGLQANIKRREKVLETKSKITHEVHCPFFPEVKQEWWWLYIANKKKRCMVTTPTQICTLREEEETQIKFQAPPKPGQYLYNVTLRSDSYLDVDVSKPIKFNVDEAKAVEESHPQWDMTDDEENKNDSDELDYTTDDEESDHD